MASDLECFSLGDCDDTLDALSECEHPAAYVCHWARGELARRACNLAALRKEIKQALRDVRRLGDEELVWMSLTDAGLTGLLAERVRRERGLASPLSSRRSPPRNPGGQRPPTS